MSEPEWSDFKFLLALSRGGSVAGAARLLGVDGSTVSRRLSAAEETMGAVLLVRGGREFAFTAEGKVALAAAEAMEAAVLGAAATLRTSKKELQGIVKLACTPSSMHFLASFQDIVAQRHPGLGVDLLSGRAAADLAKGEADIAIRSIRPKDLNLVVRHNFEWATCVYAERSYFENRVRPQSHEDLRAHRLIRYVEAFSRLPAFGWLDQFADATQPSVRVDSVDMARSMIASGAGIGTLFCTVGDPSPGLVRVFDAPIDLMSCWIVYHQASRDSARVKTVLDMLIEYHIEKRDILNGTRR
jgi:DNA-binding transcriptional LysR family regulator